MLAERQGGSLRLAALDGRAARLGLSLGMPLADARAAVPRLMVAKHDREADARALHRLAEICDAFTPLVARDGEAGLLLDVTGCAHLLGGEDELCAVVQRRLGRIGFGVKLALAGTPDAARALARFGPTGIVRSGEDEAATRGLPVSAFDMATETTLALARAGLHTLGDLADRPSQVLTARFGGELVTRLNRILGREDIRITPLREPPECMAERHFPEPLMLMESLLGVLERLAGDITGALERRAAGGRVFEGSFFRADGKVRRLTIETALATRDPKSLMRLIRLKMEALSDPLDPGFGFDAVRFAVVRSEPLAERQTGLDNEHKEPVENERAVAELVGRLVARFGSENVRRFVARDTHDPVRAGGSVPVLSDVTSAPLPESELGSAPARPLTLFEPPQLIEALAEVPDGPPLRFRWRRVLHEVARAEGPERIAPEWWREGNRAPVTRDYYRVENAEGHRFWVFREGFYEDSTMRPRWFLHGLFA